MAAKAGVPPLELAYRSPLVSSDLSVALFCLSSSLFGRLLDGLLSTGGQFLPYGARAADTFGM